MLKLSTDEFSHRIARYFLLDTLDDAKGLLHRYQQVQPFNRYVRERNLLVAGAMLAVFLISIGCMMGVFTLLPQTHWLLVLPVIVSLPLILIGGLLVQVYVFFSWIEARSMERALGTRHRAKRGPIATRLQDKLGIDIGPQPPVPWLLALIFVLLPLAVLAYSWLPAAAAFSALALSVPLVFAWLDR